MEQLLKYLDYTDGKLVWNSSVNSRAKAGAEAGYVKSNGYRSIGYQGKQYYAHRIVWALFNGYTDDCIDHVNGNRTDNRIENLRLACNSNNQNTAARSTNTSGATGVSWDSRKLKWRAQCHVNGRTTHVGYFDSKEEARHAYVAYKKSHHPYYNGRD